MYYNTTNQSGEQLKLYQEKSETQEERILRLFKKDTKLSPSQIERITGFPITSIRRALTDLKQSGRIKALDYHVKGKYGRPESVYSI